MPNAALLLMAIGHMTAAVASLLIRSGGNMAKTSSSIIPDADRPPEQRSHPGPRRVQFGDYWRLGLVLKLIVLAVAVPMLLWVWPLRRRAMVRLQARRLAPHGGWG